MAKLTFVLEDGQEIVVPLAEHVTLGRAEDSDVVVDDDRISKRHAELVRNADGSIQVFDLNSTAGTFVNGERVRSHTIQHGDKLSFGPLTAVLDLDEQSASTLSSLPGSNGKPAPVNGRPAKGGKISPRKKTKQAGNGSAADKATALPADELQARRQADEREAARLDAESKRLQTEMDAAQKQLREWQERAEKERAMHHARVESLRADEERLTPVKAAVQEAESAHAEWIKSIRALVVQHGEKNAALQSLTAHHDQKEADLRRLHDDEAAARHELETLATHREQTLAHLKQLRDDCAHDEAVLDGLRRQVAELESRSEETKELADAREDQVKVAEKKLDQLSQRRAQIEAHIKELASTEERLTQALARCRDAESGHAALTTRIAGLDQEKQRAEGVVAELASRIAALEEARAQAVKASGEAVSAREHAVESLHHSQDELAVCEKNLTARNAELAAETQRLEEARTRRTEIEQQCRDLADTEQKLTQAKEQLASVGKQLADTRAEITRGDDRIAAQGGAVKELEGEEAAAKGRIEVLHAREKDLRAELAGLSSAERAERARFEEVRQLAAEAEKEHAAQKERVISSLESSQHDLDELLSRLTPLREWKDAMDQLYARLATLPQDSPEARDLWHEIEKEKAGLLDLITAAKAQAHLEKPAGARVAEPVRTGIRPGRATGSVLIPGTTQETTLRSRLSHLRESVQREETRLEQLRLERVRHDSPSSRSSPAAEAIMREQGRHLEAKIRQDEERHHSLLRNLEISQAEEEKRRERLAELERKLAELRADIVEAERQRSELRQQADLIQTELKNHEAVLDRVMKKTAE